MAIKISESTSISISLVVTFCGAIVASLLVIAPFLYDIKANAKDVERMSERLNEQEKITRDTRELILTELTTMKVDIQYIKQRTK